MFTVATNSWTLEEAAHLLNRAGFSAAPQTLSKFHRQGRHKAVNSLFSSAPAQNPAPPPWTAPNQRREKIVEFQRANRELRQQITDDNRQEIASQIRSLRQARRREERQQTTSLITWWFDLINQTKAPLTEQMVLFWHNHFATSRVKVRSAYLMFQQNQLFRRHALGNFKQLTHAVAADPAMMLYLDLPNSKKANPNENFARELLELFTLGEGHYSEDDIKSAARAFTGYQLSRRDGTITINPEQFDRGRKTFLGQSGNFDAPQIIDLIFSHSSDRPAYFIAAKLWAWFVNDPPTDRNTHALAQLLIKNDYQLSPTLRTLFLSEQFYSPAYRRNKIKSPVDFLLQLQHQLELPLPPASLLVPALQQLGQVPFYPPNVAGWKQGRGWINTNTLLARYNYAGLLCKASDDVIRSELAKGRSSRMLRIAARRWQGPDYAAIAPAELRASPEQLTDALIQRLFQQPVPESLRAQFISYARNKMATKVNHKAVAELVHLMTSTPHYQLC